MRPRIKLALMCVASYLISILPLIITFMLNFGKYTESAAATVKLTVGGLIVLALLLARTLGRMLPSGLGGTLVAFIVAFLLEAILADLVLLLGMFLLGECLDIILFRGRIKRLREDMLVEKTATATAEQVEQIMKKYSGGRV